MIETMAVNTQTIRNSLCMNPDHFVKAHPMHKQESAEVCTWCLKEICQRLDKLEKDLQAFKDRL